MSDLVGNPEDRFSRVAAQFCLPTFLFYKINVLYDIVTSIALTFTNMSNLFCVEVKVKSTRFIIVTSD